MVSNMSGVNFNKMPCIYWSSITRASYLQRQIIVHSILYYQMDVNVLSDKDFDQISKQLLELKKSMNVEEYHETEYFYCFKDFDGNTGFYLYDALNQKDKKYLKAIANLVLANYRGAP